MFDAEQSPKEADDNELNPEQELTRQKELEDRKKQLEEKFAQAEQSRQEQLAQLKEKIEQKKLSLNEAAAKINEQKDLIEFHTNKTMGAITNYFTIKKIKAKVGAGMQSLEIMQREFDEIDAMQKELEEIVVDKKELQQIEEELSGIYAQQAAEAELAAFERNKEIRDVSRVIEKHNCIIAHGFAATGMQRAVTVMRDGATWKDRLNAVIGLQPEIPCSSAREDVDPPDSKFYYHIGVLVAGGEVVSANRGDAGSRVVDGERTVRENNDEIEERIDESINNPAGLNEIIIRDPQVNALYIEEDILRYLEEDVSNGRRMSSDGMTYGNTPEDIKQMMKEFKQRAQELGIPMYIRGGDGAFYELHDGEMIVDLVQDGYTFEGQKMINKGKQITRQEMMERSAGVSEEAKKQAREAIFEDSPFKTNNPERRIIDEWNKGKKAFDALRNAEGSINIHDGSFMFGEYTDRTSFIQNMKKGMRTGDSRAQHRQAYYAYGFAHAARKAGDLEIAQEIINIASEYVSEEEFDALVERRVGPNGGFRIGEEDLKDITTHETH